MRRILGFALVVLASATLSVAQTTSTTRLIPYSGTTLDAAGSPLSGPVTITFELYEEQDGGAPLWRETHRVETDQRGRYLVYLGAVTSIPQAGVYGYNELGGAGVAGFSSTGTTSFSGVAGSSTSGTAVYGSSVSGLAGHFNGNVTISGTLSKGGGSFRIDHPRDPTNKYLSHSFVESPDMMNVYNGNVTLDASGEAWVTLPDWFEALNGDCRYQLTALGAPAPDLYIATEISGNRFQIAGGRPGGRVSWQVTGIRQDAWANAHRIAVEQDKPATERGSYLHPKEHGQPESALPAGAAGIQRPVAGPLTRQQ